MSRSAALFALIFVSACVAPSRPPPQARASVPAQAAPPAGTFRPPPVAAASDAGQLIGKSADALVRRLGETRIDLTEGDARKLQFVSGRCVLDVFLYPRTPGGEPVAAHVDARLRDSGADTDRGACIAEIERAAR